MDFVALDALAFEQMGHRKSHVEREVGAVYYHGRRVSRGVLALRARVTDDASHDDLLRCAAMFHDLGKGYIPHEVVGARLAMDMLAPHLSKAERNEVARLITAHCDRSPGSGRHDLWACLLQDADLMDHFGAQEIFMCFGVLARQNKGMDEAARYWAEHLEDTLARHMAMLNFDAARRVMRDKADFQRAFAARFAVECEGGYWAGEGER